MSTTEPKKPETKTKPETDKPKRGRSPRYPSITLAAAIEKARKLWDSQRKHEAHIDASLKSLGYTTQSGDALRTIAAMKHYGLIEDSGSGDDRKIKLSESAQDILLLPENDPRKQRALEVAARAPAIHATLWERYGAHLPDDAAMIPFLVRDKGFNESVVGDVLGNYRSAFALAKLDKNADSSPDNEQENTRQETKPEGLEGKQLDARSAFTPMNPDAAIQEMPVLVGPGKVARIPFPMTEEDFDLFIGTLNLWKKKLVKKPDQPTPKVEGLPEL